MKNMEYRQIAIRAVDQNARIVSGIAVPYNRTENGEVWENGAATVVDDAKLFAYHDEPIGRIVEHTQTEDGLAIRAYISKTRQGDDIYEMLKDGTLDTFSVGFDSAVSERTEDGVTVIKSARVREVSVVPFGWFHEGAKVSEVRNEPMEDTATTVDGETEPGDGSEEEKDTTVTENTVDPTADIAELRQSVEGIERTIATIATRSDAPAVSHRSVGEIVKGIIANDASAIEEYKRVYSGGVVADSYNKDAWVGDLIRVVDEAATLRNIFRRQATPSTGMNVEFGVLDANTIAVTEQEAEGDILDSGNVSVTTATAPIKTYGGTSTLSLQEIERSDPDMVALTLLAIARKAGARLNAAMRTHYSAAVTASTNDVFYPETGAGYTDFLDAVVEAADKFQTNGLDISALIVDKALYKQLVTLEASDGRPVFLVDAAAQGNIAGRLNLVGLSGSLVGIPVICDTSLSGKSAFVNRDAITAWESPIAQLQDTGIADLTRSFGAYMYAAYGTTIPAGIVPLVAD
jgi:HK97 family phage prohead protease